MRSVRALGCVVAAVALWTITAPGAARAQGRQLGPNPTLEWEGPIDYLATGGTLLDCQPAQGCGGLAGLGSAANCAARETSTINVAGFPNLPGLRIVHARLNWTATGPSTAEPDPSVTLSPPGAPPFEVLLDDPLSERFIDGLPADFCATVPFLCPGAVACDLLFYSAHADVTEAVQAHVDGGGALNGQWSIGDVQMSGAREDDPDTGVAVLASLTIGGWSLIVVYESEALPLRRIYYYQGMELNEGLNRRLRPSGFRAPPDGTVDVSIMVLEGDEGIMGDSLAINGQLVSDPCNPVRNVFNSTVSAGRAEGCVRGEHAIDIDRFHLEGVLDAGDESADVELIIPGGIPGSSEQLFTNWLVLAFDHRPASFESVKPEKAALPPSGSTVQADDEITYVITVRNTGGDFASNVRVTDQVPEGTTYIPNTFNVDRRPVADLPDRSLPLTRGFNLADLPEIDLIAPNEAHVLQFQVRVNADVDDEFIIRNAATIEADDIPPAQSDLVVHAVGREPDGGIPDIDAAPLPPPRDAGAPPTVRLDMRPTVDMGRCPVGEQVSITGRCVPIECPDGSVLEGSNCVDPPANPCGPGTQLVDGRCEAICGEGLRWDNTCQGGGQCRYIGDPPCNSGSDAASSGGCDCRSAAGPRIPSAVLAAALLLGLTCLRKRLIGRDTAGTPKGDRH